jgi:Sulfite exporter TauE/SafE
MLQPWAARGRMIQPGRSDFPRFWPRAAVDAPIVQPYGLGRDLPQHARSACRPHDRHRRNWRRGSCSGSRLLRGIPIHVAIAAAMMSYVLTGLIGTLVYAGENSIRWGTAWWLCAGAMPAALAGALAAGRASSLLLEVLLGLLTAASGIHALLASSAGDGAHSNAISSPALGFIGAVTGFGSALSGTSGPLILVPILI